MWLSWKAATERALFAEGGFYRSELPAAHFRTSVPASPLFAEALATLVRAVDEALDRPAALDVVEMGAGNGELLTRLVELVPDRVRATAVEVRSRPANLPEGIGWSPKPPESVTGVVIANEWLANVPVDVVELCPNGACRIVLVDPVTGDERLGHLPTPEDQAWLDRWWRPVSVGDRAEIGRPRDAAWADLLRHLDKGVAIAIDCGHLLPDRPPLGSLAAYRDGRSVPPLPDGSCDIRAHVAFDSCAESGVGKTIVTTQREALRALGLSGRRPPLTLAGTDPQRYLRRLRRAGEEAELLDPAGLGAFGWLLCTIGVSPLAAFG
jgi:SAM-dependent MidA family methyltransferase